jgi:hypothetical protein
VDHWLVIVGKNDDGSYQAIDSADGKPLRMQVGEDGLLHGSGGAKGNKPYEVKEAVFFETEKN